MKAIVCLILGIAIGWCFGYTRPSARNQRELLAQDQYVRDHLHMTDAEWAETGRRVPQYFENMTRQDEMAAVVALAVFNDFECGATNQAKHVLLNTVGSYYRVYRNRGGDSNLLTHIEAAAQKYPAVAAEISRKTE